jgi:hypothetical protein
MFLEKLSKPTSFVSVKVDKSANARGQYKNRRALTRMNFS